MEHLILEHLSSEIFTPAFIMSTAEKMYNQYLSQTESSASNTEILEKKLKEVRSSIDNIVNAIAAGMFHESMKEKMESLESQKNDLIIQIAEERSKRHNKFSKEDIVKFLDQGRGILDRSFKEQKTLVNTFVNKIILKADEVVIELKIDQNDNLTDVPVDTGGGGN